MNDREAPIHDIDPATLATWLENGEVLLVDVRENAEHADARIKGSRLNPLSVFNPSAFEPGDGQKLVLYCAAGMRSHQAGEILIASGHAEAYHLAGGLKEWVKAGLPIERGS
jgi:rhodanese-related sulfurtransferase